MPPFILAFFARGVAAASLLYYDDAVEFMNCVMPMSSSICNHVYI